MENKLYKWLKKDTQKKAEFLLWLIGLYRDKVDKNSSARRNENMKIVNRCNVYLEKGGFFLLVHWFSSIEIHLHIGSFDKILTVCQFGVWFS